MTDLFHVLERIAGVTPVEGRGWYGIRRKATDVYEDYESDERVLNDQTGHRNSETRRNAYQEREREEIRVKSAETRRRVRAAAFGRQIEWEGKYGEGSAPEALRNGAPLGGTHPNSTLTQSFAMSFRQSDSDP